MKWKFLIDFQTLCHCVKPETFQQCNTLCSFNELRNSLWAFAAICQSSWLIAVKTAAKHFNKVCQYANDAIGFSAFLTSMACLTKNKTRLLDLLNKQDWKFQSNARDKIVNWTKLKIGQIWKLDKIENWTKLKIGQNRQNWRFDKNENWKKLKIGQYWKLNKIENWTLPMELGWLEVCTDKLHDDNGNSQSSKNIVVIFSIVWVQLMLLRFTNLSTFGTN